MDGEPPILTREGPVAPVWAAPTVGRVAAVSSYGFVLLLVLLLVVVVRTVPEAGVLAKAIVDPIAHSTSAGAALAFAGYLALCVSAAACSTLVTRAGRPARLSVLPGMCRPTCASVITEREARAAAHHWVRHALLVLPLSVLLGNVANLIAQIQVQAASGLPIDAAAYHWQGETNTYSYLMHAHAGKSALAAMAHAGFLPGQGFDLGDGLAGLVPAWTAWICGLCIVLACTSAMLVFPAVMRRAPSVWIGALFVISTFNCIKTIADGGPLTYRFAPMFVALVWCLSPELACSPRVRRWVWACALGISAGVAAVWCMTGAMAGSEASSGLIATIALLAALWLSAIRRMPDNVTMRSTRTVRTVRAALRIGCGGFFIAAMLQSVIQGVGAVWLPLEAGIAATHCPPDAAACHSVPVAGRTTVEVYRSFGEDPLKPRYTFIHAEGVLEDTRLLAVVQARRVRTGPTPVSASMRSTHADGPIDVRVVLAEPVRSLVLVEVSAHRMPRIFDAVPGPHTTHNHHVLLHIAAARLRTQGLEEFSFVPLRNREDIDAFGFDLAQGSGR